MPLGTATWQEGPAERRALVARLDSGRVADLSRIEAVRLGKLGEGQPERLAEVLVPSSLRQLLEGGPRALTRARQAAAYAEKWDRRGTLPVELAPDASHVALGPCLVRPARVRRMDGSLLDRFRVLGPGCEVSEVPQAGLAAVGAQGGGMAGFCLYLEAAQGVVLGAWMVEAWPTGLLELAAEGARRSVPLKAWEGLELPPLRPGEVVLLPPARVKAFPPLEEGAVVQVQAGAEVLAVTLRPGAPHPTLQ